MIGVQPSTKLSALTRRAHVARRRAAAALGLPALAKAAGRQIDEVHEHELVRKRGSIPAEADTAWCDSGRTRQQASRLSEAHRLQPRGYTTGGRRRSFL